MDLSFSLRNKRSQLAPGSGVPDLVALLSSAAMRQAMTPTARAFWHGADAVDSPALDPRVALFSGAATSDRPHSARFAELGESALNRGQSS